MIQLNKKDLKSLRERWYIDQNGICPILKKEYPIENFCIDHAHALKSEGANESGKGCARGNVHFQANAWEGKVNNSFKRLGLEKHIDIISALRNLADYLEHNRQHTEELLIHPNEKPRKPVLMKSSYNKLAKIAIEKKLPEYKDKYGNYTKALEKLFIKYKLEPEFKK